MLNQQIIRNTIMNVNQLSREELIVLVKKIMEAAGTEEEHQNNINLLRQQVADPKVTDYIYWSKKEMTAEEVVDKALQYKPIIL